MSSHEWAERYEAAIVRFEGHLKNTDDGTLRLDAKDGKSIGIDDPVIFADLKRSLDETNRKIRRGELKLDQITKYAP
jgi:hypothetical protein